MSGTAEIIDFSAWLPKKEETTTPENTFANDTRADILANDLTHMVMDQLEQAGADLSQPGYQIGMNGLLELISSMACRVYGVDDDLNLYIDKYPDSFITVGIMSEEMNNKE